MTPTIPPGDANSLLVPIHLDAWVVDSQNQESLAWYFADYAKLKQFDSPIPGAFDISDAAKPTTGVHLHWALPDALTHGRSRPGGGTIQFPHVPNRWLIARFNTPDNGPWQCKLWVVQSDFLSANAGVTATDLSGTGVASIELQAPGAAIAIPAGSVLQLLSANGQTSAEVTTAAATAQGATQIEIEAQDFSLGLPAGSSVTFGGTSAFLDPTQPTYMQAAPGSSTVFGVQSTGLGTSYTVEAWETLPDAGGPLFLQAVGPGNISFAAYAPFARDVFSFTDPDLPPEGTGLYTYSYLVTGWYSDTQTGDPLRGVSMYDPAVWATEADWQAQNPAQRFQTLLGYLQWSVQGDAGATPPSTSLYHGLVVDVQWPYSTLGNAGIDPQNVSVAVGDTAVDALAALIQAQAQQQANENPAQGNAWLAAGTTLAELIQAAIYDLLDDYAVPGGAALIREQIERSWFGASQGGTVWEAVASVPQVAGESAESLALTPQQRDALTRQVAALNSAQRSLDEARRHLASLQADFYMIWLKVGRANSFGWGEAPTTVPPWPDLSQFMQEQIYPNLVNQVWDQLCAVGTAQAQLPGASDNAAATQWADQNWTFPNPNGGTQSLTDLGLMLKASTMPHFWHPNDPVLLIGGIGRSQKHGQDGRYNADGTMTCRLPGQTISGLQITGQPAIDVAALQSNGVDLDPYVQSAAVPAIPGLVHEAFFADPINATLMANALGGNATAISAAITGLLAQNPGSAAWVGTAPLPFAIRAWQQAWAPLFLEWSVQYYPTGSGEGTARQFSLADWQFDGEEYSWLGTGFDQNYYITFDGRTILTAQAPLVFASKIQKYLSNNQGIDSQQLDTLLTTIGDWDLVSQSLSGLLDQLVTLIEQETFPPSGESGPVQCPRPASGGTPPTVATLVGDEYRAMPRLEGGGENANYFYPVRGGFLQFQKLQVVDAFGQNYPINFEQGFEPLLSQNLTPSNPSLVPPGAFQLAPRLVQDTRLDLRFLANDGSGQDILVSNNPNAICGWLLPNHLDGGIAVYDSGGVLLGELVPLSAPDNWRPRPGAPGTNPPPQQPGDIPNATLRAVVSSFATQSSDVFQDVLRVIDETLWMVDPLGGRKDQFLSVLIGRPLAVVQAQLQLKLHGDPAYNQMWNTMLPPQQPYTWLRDVGDVESIPFPVRLGSLALRGDGLIGYFLPASDNYSTFYSVHYPDEMSAGDNYVRQIVGSSGEYTGDVYLNCQSSDVTATLILDPRGSVHAYSGILPVVNEALPSHLVEEFIKGLNVTFQTGPVITGQDTLRLPIPAESHGVWAWIQRVAPPAGWETDSIVDAGDQARLPDNSLQLREGWLQLSDITE